MLRVTDFWSTGFLPILWQCSPVFWGWMFLCCLSLVVLINFSSSVMIVNFFAFLSVMLSVTQKQNIFSNVTRRLMKYLYLYEWCIYFGTHRHNIYVPFEIFGCFTKGQKCSLDASKAYWPTTDTKYVCLLSWEKSECTYSSNMIDFAVSKPYWHLQNILYLSFFSNAFTGCFIGK